LQRCGQAVNSFALFLVDGERSAVDFHFVDRQHAAAAPEQAAGKFAIFLLDAEPAGVAIGKRQRPAADEWILFSPRRYGRKQNQRRKSHQAHGISSLSQGEYKLIYRTTGAQFSGRSHNSGWVAIRFDRRGGNDLTV